MVAFTGLLSVTQNETALAIVIGHEIAHAVAKHGSERMSQSLVQQLGGVALQVALSQKNTRNARPVFDVLWSRKPARRFATMVEAAGDRS